MQNFIWLHLKSRFWTDFRSFHLASTATASTEAIWASSRTWNRTWRITLALIETLTHQMIPFEFSANSVFRLILTLLIREMVQKRTTVNDRGASWLRSPCDKRHENRLKRTLNVLNLQNFQKKIDTFRKRASIMLKIQNCFSLLLVDF